MYKEEIINNNKCGLEILKYLSKYINFEDFGVGIPVRGKPIFIGYTSLDLLDVEYQLEEGEHVIMNARIPSNVLVLDLDNDTLEENLLDLIFLLKSLRIKPLVIYTGNKGFHLWYVFPKDIDIYRLFKNKIENLKNLKKLIGIKIDEHLLKPSTFTRPPHSWNYKQGRFAVLLPPKSHLFKDILQSENYDLLYYYAYKCKSKDTFLGKVKDYQELNIKEMSENNLQHFIKLIP